MIIHIFPYPEHILFLFDDIKIFVGGTETCMLYDNVLDGGVLSEPFHQDINAISLFLQILFPVSGNIVFRVLAGNEHERY